MKRNTLFSALLAVLVLGASGSLHAEERFFRFPYPGREQISEITRIVSIDAVKDGWVYAYADDKGWDLIGQRGLSIETLPHPGSLNDERCSDVVDTRGWDSYPSHSAYLTQMQDFPNKYPNLCTFETIGKSIKSRSIVAVRLSTGSSKPKPHFFYSSTMHGDETTGYILLLRLIDYMASNYGQSTTEGQRVTRILDNLDITINPLANPDGTYRSNDASISSPIRGNANGVDLNRNFPDPFGSNNPDGNSTQTETKLFVAYAKQKLFDLGANIHGGIELVNYPWDSVQTRHPDDKWYQNISRTYASLAQKSAGSGYFTGQNNGITNGYDWYEVRGGRQDYTNKVLGCRELTLEVSNTKFIPSSQLNAHWSYNKNALLALLEEGLKGIHGTITNARTGEPVSGAKVSLSITNELPVQSKSNGGFFRFVLPGTYSLKVEGSGFQPQTLSSITVQSGAPTVLDVKLQPIGSEPEPEPEPQPTPLKVSSPASQSVNAGAQVTFNIQASGGTAPYRYQWYMNSQSLSGATSSSYRLTAQSSHHGASFYCLVTDAKSQSAKSSSATLTVITPQPQAKDLIQNGDFEKGVAPWMGSTGTIGNWPLFESVSGRKSAWMGGNGMKALERLSQKIQIPGSARSATLSFQVHVSTAETTTNRAYDTLSLEILDASGNLLDTPLTLSNLDQGNGYKRHSVDLSAYKGQSIEVLFRLREDMSSQTSFVIDAMTLPTE